MALGSPHNPHNPLPHAFYSSPTWKCMFTRASLLQRSLHVTLGQNLGLKISKVATSTLWSFGLWESFPQHLPKPSKSKLVNSQTSTSTLQASWVLNLTTYKYFERWIGEFQEVQGSMIHASPIANEYNLLWNSRIWELWDFNTHCFLNRRTLEWRRVGIHDPRVLHN